MRSVTTSVGAVFAVITVDLKCEVFAEVDIANALIR